jgi:tetratricopeptide (TPR) repeat protein
MPKKPKKLSSQNSTDPQTGRLRTSVSSSEAGDIACLYQGGKFSDCLHASKKFLKKHPDHKNILMIAGAASMALRDYDSAEKYFQRIHRRFPNDADALNNLGTAYFNGEKFNLSIECYKKAYILGKRNPNFFINYSNTLRKTSQLEASNKVLKEAISLYPKNSLLLVAATYSLIDVGDVNNAVETARHAISLEPRSAKCHSAMGSATAACGDFEAALSHYKKATSVPNATEQEHYSHGALLGELGQFEAALNETRKALQKNPRSEKSLLNAAWFNYKLGHFDDAIIEYSKALTVNPNSSDAFSGLGTVYSATGEHAKAVEFFKHAVTHAPKNPKVAFGLARALAAIGNEFEAVKVFDQYVPFLENNGDLYDYAMSLEAAGRPDEAIEVFTRLASGGYKPISVAEHLFNAFELKSQLDKAEISLEPLRECPEAQNLLFFFEGVLFFRKKQYALAEKKLGMVAVKELSKASQKRYFQVLGEVFDKLNRPDAAMGCFGKMNGLFLSDKPDPSLMARKLLDRLDRDLSRNEPTTSPRIHNPLPVSDEPKIGFIIGFPRSGTTLLDTVLRTHSRISVIEERPMLSHAMSVTLGGAPNSEDDAGFADFNEKKVFDCREVYLRNLKKELGNRSDSAELIFDKLPLHILRVMPESW